MHVSAMFVQIGLLLKVWIRRTRRLLLVVPLRNVYCWRCSAYRYVRIRHQTDLITGSNEYRDRRSMRVNELWELWDSSFLVFL